MKQRSCLWNVTVERNALSSALSSSTAKEVFRVMTDVSKCILAKCVDAREEQESSDKSDLEVGKKPTGDSDDSSNAGVDVPVRRAEVEVDEVPPPPPEEQCIQNYGEANPLGTAKALLFAKGKKTSSWMT